MKTFYPKGSRKEGGDVISVVGAGFINDADHGIVPYCKFGDKVVKAEFISSVRIKCRAPPNPKAAKELIFGVSLNRQDWVYAKDKFRYYGDIHKATFTRIEPSMGPVEGGKVVKIYGEGLDVMLSEYEFVCVFEPIFSGKKERHLSRDALLV